MKLMFLIIYVFILFFSFRFGQSSAKNQFCTRRRPSHGEAFYCAATYFHSFRVCFVNIEFDWWSTRPDVDLLKRGTEWLIFLGWSYFLIPRVKFFSGTPGSIFFFGPSIFLAPKGWRKKNPGSLPLRRLFFYKNVPPERFFSTFLFRFGNFLDLKNWNFWFKILLRDIWRNLLKLVSLK